MMDDLYYRPSVDAYQGRTKEGKEEERKKHIHNPLYPMQYGREQDKNPSTPPPLGARVCVSFRGPFRLQPYPKVLD